MDIHNIDSVPELKHAILLFGTDSHHGKSTRYATVHPVRSGENGVPIICPGTPATKEALLTAIRELVDDRMAPELLPAHLLGKGADHLVWYRPAMKKNQWFDCAQLGKVTALLPIPATVWLAQPLQGELYVFALRNDDRPDRTTKLFQAPFFNVWDNGRVCIGNAMKPTGPEALIPEKWEEMFFNSWFSHPNTPKLVRHKEGLYPFFKDLIAKKHRVFPKAKLVPLKKTLGDAFETLLRGDK